MNLQMDRIAIAGERVFQMTCDCCIALEPKAAAKRLPMIVRHFAEVIYCDRCDVITKTRTSALGAKFAETFEIAGGVPSLATLTLAECPHGCGERYASYPDRCTKCERLIG